MYEVYCIKSDKCKKTNCPRHLRGFNGLYINLAEFNCEKELQENEYTDNIK